MPFAKVYRLHRYQQPHLRRELDHGRKSCSNRMRSGNGPWLENPQPGPSGPLAFDLPGTGDGTEIQFGELDRRRFRETILKIVEG